MCCKSAQPFRCMHDHHEEEQEDEDRDDATDAWRTDAADVHVRAVRGKKWPPNGTRPLRSPRCPNPILSRAESHARRARYSNRCGV